MPVFNIDLEDGNDPVSFSLNNNDARRFMAFMAECEQIKKGQNRIMLNGYQLLQALDFCWPDRDIDHEQGENELMIQPRPAYTAIDNVAMPAGTYAWYSDCPDEGCVLLDEEMTAPAALGVRGYDLISHLYRQREFSLKTFGPGPLTNRLIDHIMKEFTEIVADPLDVKEWVDVMILAMDGAYRTGATPEQVTNALKEKQKRNEGRKWPDWRTSDPDKAMEHISEDPAYKIG
jgi:hypothetical protein